MTYENVKVYNVSGVFGLHKKAVGVELGDKIMAETYRDNPGLEIYMDNGETPYVFVIPSATITDDFLTDSDNVVLKSDIFVVGTAYIVNGKQYTTLVAGELTVPASGLTLGGNTVDVAFLTEGSRVYDGISFTNVILATKVIKTVADMDAVFFNGTNITGHFVLGNDIDYNGDANLVKTYTAGDNGGAGGFMGTFDGRGHTIENYKQIQKAETYNIFGLLRSATVENVNFTNVTINPYATSSLFARNSYGSTIRNITITNANFTSAPVGNTGANGALLIGWFVGGQSGVGSAKFENINITMGTTQTTEGYVHNLFGAGGWEYGNINIIQVTNVNLYNVKQGNLQWICGTTNNTATVYNTLTGLHVYTDNGTTEYSF